MNILICSSYLHAWNSVRPEAEMFIGFVKAGHNVTIMTQGEAEYVQRFKEEGVEVIDCYPSKKVCLKTIKKIHQFIKQRKIDICYSFNSKTIPNAAFACIGTKAKMITYRGTTGGLYRHDPSAYLTHLHPRVDGIICVSKAVENDIVKRVWKNKENIITIYKGHKLEWYQVAPTLRSEFNLKDDDIIAVCATHVRPSKGISLLLQATHYIKNPNFHLILAGSGYEPHFDEIKSSPMSERIHFIGHRTDVPSLMTMADFQVQPSISGEGLPRTIIEAMANATPSVVTTTGGSPELVIDGETGYVVNTGDVKGFADAMNKFANNKIDCEQMGKASQTRLNQYFSSTETVSQHLAFFHKLTANG
jgi:glycosyltransferase involved in cell wall biosynthesis